MLANRTYKQKPRAEVLLEVRIIAGEPNRVRLPETPTFRISSRAGENRYASTKVPRVRRISISLPGMVEGFSAGVDGGDR